MKNLIAGVSLITASVILAVAWVIVNPGSLQYVPDMPMIPMVIWLAYFVPGLYFLFLARDKPSP